MWLFNLLIFLAVFILRKREPELKRPYKVPGYPIIPIIASLGGIFILVTTSITQPILAFIGIGITLLGIPVYLVNKQKRSQKRKRSNRIIIVFLKNFVIQRNF